MKTTMYYIERKRQRDIFWDRFHDGTGSLSRAGANPYGLEAPRRCLEAILSHLHERNLHP